MRFPLEGRVAIVTGSSRRIGKVIALQLGADMAKVVVCARTERSSEDNPGSIGETVEAIRGNGGTALPVRADVTNDAEVLVVVDKILAEFGRVDVLVNNAGLLDGRGTFLGGDPALLDVFNRTNLRAPYIICQMRIQSDSVLASASLIDARSLSISSCMMRTTSDVCRSASCCISP